MLTLMLFRHYLFSSHAGALIRRIAWICVGATAVAVFSFVVVLSVMNGFHKDIRQRLLSTEAHLSIFWPKGYSVKEVENSEVFKKLKVRKKMETHVFDRQDVILRTLEGTFGGAIARGMDSSALRRFWSNTEATSDSAKSFKSNGYTINPGEVLLGIDLARTLGVYEGDELIVVPPESLLAPSGSTPIYDRMKIKAIVETKVTDLDSKGLFFVRGQSLRHMSDTASHEVGLEIYMDDPDAFQMLKNELKSEPLRVESWVDRNSTLFFALKLEKIVISVFLALSALIAGFSIVSILVLLLTQKRRDIGAMMAMGLSAKAGERLFTRFGMLLSSMGLIGGMSTGVFACCYMEKHPFDILPDFYFSSRIPVSLDIYFLTMLAICAIIFALIGSWLPAHLNVARSPVEALRH